MLHDSGLLSPEDEERTHSSACYLKVADACMLVISSLTARANAIKMLHSRIKLLKSYLESLPASHLTSSSETSNGTPDTVIEIDYPLLRSIQALLVRLPLLLPSSDLSNFKHETQVENSDVELVSLLGGLGRSVKDARELGRKFAVVEEGKKSAKKMDLAHGRIMGDFGIDEAGEDEGRGRRGGMDDLFE